MPGITDLSEFTFLGQMTLQIDIDREWAARYGLTTGDINATVRVAIGGDVPAIFMSWAAISISRLLFGLRRDFDNG